MRRRDKRWLNAVSAGKRVIPFVKTVMVRPGNISLSIGQEIGFNGQIGKITKIDHVLFQNNTLITIGEIEVNEKDPAQQR
ncbi:hypothetical protein [Brevibacillus sp. FIR094]|uniref:hypothetical protein n=1 Tax=Brevibacillus sp. FIR094 TaxID=3134809 RepID=UPI003D1C80CB